MRRPHSGLPAQEQAPYAGKAKSLALLLAAQVSAMSVWFSSSAAVADIKRTHALSSGAEAMLTLLTMQTCAGFLLALISIQLAPLVQVVLGWPGAFTMLAFGPVLGCAAMWRLRRDPEAHRLAGGRISVRRRGRISKPNPQGAGPCRSE